MDDVKQSHDTQARSLGLSRWVQMAFMIYFLFALWLFDKLLTVSWKTFDEPNPMVVTALAAVLAAVSGLVLYRNEKVNRVTHEVVGELAKVTWPSRRETYTSSIVVIVTSIIAAAIIGSFDAAWSAITDLIYKV